MKSHRVYWASEIDNALQTINHNWHNEDDSGLISIDLKEIEKFGETQFTKEDIEFVKALRRIGIKSNTIDIIADY